MTRIYAVHNNEGRLGYSDDFGVTWSWNPDNASRRGFKYSAQVKLPASKSPSGVDEEFLLAAGNTSSKVYKTTDLGSTVTEHMTIGSGTTTSFNMGNWQNLPDGRGVLQVHYSLTSSERGLYITNDGWYSHKQIYQGAYGRQVRYNNDVIILQIPSSVGEDFKVYDWDGNLIHNQPTVTNRTILDMDIWTDSNGEAYLYMVGRMFSTGHIWRVKLSDLSGPDVNYEVVNSSFDLYSNNKLNSVQSLQIIENTMFIAASETISLNNLWVSTDLGQSFSLFETPSSTSYQVFYYSPTIYDFVDEKALLFGGAQMLVISKDSNNQYTSIDSRIASPVVAAQNIATLPLFNINAIAPSDIVLSSASLPESASLGTVVGTLTTNGNNTPFVYSLSGGLADNSAFSISGSDLVLNAALDYEAKSSYTVEVSVTDAGSNVFAKEFVISVTDVNEAPFGLALSSTSITENNSVGDIIGSLSASDPEGSGLTFSIVGGADAASFSISGNQLLASEVFDFETKTSYEVQIRATDAGGLSVEGPFIVTILNLVSDDPVSVSSSEVTVLSSGAVITSVAVNPKLVAVTLGGQPLPTGSILRNSETGQKFLKAAGDEFAFVEIELAPKPAWNWSADGQAAWNVMQAL